MATEYKSFFKNVGGNEGDKCKYPASMDTLKLWKKLNALVKTRTPVKTARKMVESGEITQEEISWALAALATLPITMFETMQEKGTM